jgi:hypothetical protein
VFTAEFMTVMCVCVCVCVYTYIYIGHTQKNGAISKLNRKCISLPTPTQRKILAAATVQVSHVLIAILQCEHRGSQNTHPHGNQHVRCNGLQ